MDYFLYAFKVDNAEDHLNSIRRLFIVGEPGSGKTELFVQFCAYAIAHRLRVLILGPTGQLVAAYRQRIPETEYVRIETIHAGLRIYREDEKLVEHSPPSTLQLYDAILIDECSQLDNKVADKVKYAVYGLSHNPFVAIAADFKQLQPVGSSGVMEKWCNEFTTVTLKTIYRTDDPALLKFLSHARCEQPARDELYEFFVDRRFRGVHNYGLLYRAVSEGMQLEKTIGHPFVWLCLTNGGAREVCDVALRLLGLSSDASMHGSPEDPNVGECHFFYAHPGVLVRLTRNLDKERGFVNGAVGTVRTILARHGDTPTVFTVQLSTGVMVLVHPIWNNKRCFLPCTYGYATTIRRAQGATYHHGCIWFDHVYPPERGYGYVATSRFKSKKGIYLFGKIRRTDWRPVRAKAEEHSDQEKRGEESKSDYDSSEDEAEARHAIHSVKARRDEQAWRDYGEDPHLYGDFSDSEDSYRSDDDDELDKLENYDYFGSIRASLGEERTGKGLPDSADAM